MNTRTTVLAGLVALSWLAPGVGVRADITLTTPAGLKPGDEFRFVFVTDGGMTAGSSDIADYDRFVNAQAGGATYNGATVSWLAIGSTSSVNAIDHISQTDTSVYLADGTRVTTSTTTAGLWSGSLLNPIGEDLSGKAQAASVWTGTSTSGQGSSEGVLGADIVMWGSSLFTDSNWVETEAGGNDGALAFFGISETLVVPGAMTAVPEPSTALVAMFGAVSFLAYGWSRRREPRRRVAA